MVDVRAFSYVRFSLVIPSLIPVAACGTDASAPMENAQDADSQAPTDAGHGGSSSEQDASAAGADAAGLGCQVGTTEPCTCPDGQSAGESLCVDGRFADTCLGCPCQDGDTQVCDCPGADFGTQTCGAGAFGPCECMGVGEDAGTPACPEGFVCMDFTGQGAVCADASQQFALPPRCNDVADCAQLGLAFAVCTNVPALGLMCLQACTP